MDLLKRTLLSSLSSLVLLAQLCGQSGDLQLDAGAGQLPLDFSRRMDYRVLNSKIQTEGTAVSAFGAWVDQAWGEDYFRGSGGMVSAVTPRFSAAVAGVSGLSYFAVHPSLGFSTWELDQGLAASGAVHFSKNAGLTAGALSFKKLRGSVFGGALALEDLTLPFLTGGVNWNGWQAGGLIAASLPAEANGSLMGEVNSSALRAAAGWVGWGGVTVFAATLDGAAVLDAAPLYRWVLGLDKFTVDLDLRVVLYGFAAQGEAGLGFLTLGSRFIGGMADFPRTGGSFTMEKSEWSWEQFRWITFRVSDSYRVQTWQPTFGLLDLWGRVEAGPGFFTVGRRIFWVPGASFVKLQDQPAGEAPSSEPGSFWTEVSTVIGENLPDDWWWAGIYLQAGIRLH